MCAKIWQLEVEDSLNHRSRIRLTYLLILTIMGVEQRSDPASVLILTIKGLDQRSDPTSVVRCNFLPLVVGWKAASRDRKVSWYWKWGTCQNTTSRCGVVYDERTAANVARWFIWWFIYYLFWFIFHLSCNFTMVWLPILEWTFKEEFKNEQKWNDLWILYKNRTYDCFYTNEACSAYTMFIRGWG